MRVLFILFFSIYAFASSDLLHLYLDKGIAAVQAQIEAGLADKDFWKKELSEQDLRYGYYPNGQMIVVVDKSAQKLNAYELKDMKLQNRFSQKVITGLLGDKLREGDLKTPIGAYEIQRKMVPPDIYYGPWAFVLNYPNAYDSARARTGGGIWIHGFPLDGDVRYDAYKTKGCVVMTNDLLLDFEAMLGSKDGVVLINENGDLQTNVDEISQILAGLFVWKRAWQFNDIKTYLDFYSPDFKRPNGSGFKSFKESKTSIFARNENKQIIFKNIKISPYPNIGGEKLFRVSFYEDYMTANYNFHGNKVLYVKLDKEHFKILTED